MSKIRIATTSLAGCFGCHMSFLDMDERLVGLLEYVEFDRSPLTDIKHCQPCDIGLVEGGLCNAENVHVLREFRQQCKILIAVGACAINGGVPAMRNHYTVQECLEEAYLNGVGVDNPMIPSDPELPLLLSKVEASLTNSGTSHALKLNATPPQGWASTSTPMARKASSR